MKKLLIATMLLLSFSAYADEDKSPFDQNLKGVNYVDFKKLNIPPNIESQNSYKRSQLTSKGFIEEEDFHANFLLRILPNKAAQEIKSYKNNPNPGDSHLKETLAEIKMSVPFKQISFIQKKDIIGFAAGNSYSQEEGKEGWTGVAEFFNYPEIGTCSYDQDRVTAVLLSKDITYKTINEKPYTSSVKGTNSSGFLYSVHWYTDNVAKEVKCANMKFDKDTINKVIELAKKIDKE